jgi:glyoxylase-like metal-dependent hydrolase (beta-lactamase superfamily II)
LYPAKNDAVLIDAQFTLADAEKVAREIKNSGKKLTAIYVSYGDPDFYFGLEVFKKYFPEVTAYASPATIEHIKGNCPKEIRCLGRQIR